MEKDLEIAALKQEVARLRQEMNELRQFIHYHPPGTDDADQPLAAHLTMRCAILQLSDPRSPAKTQMNLFASAAGPSLSLLDAEEKSRIILALENNSAEIAVRAPGHQSALSLFENKGETSLLLHGPNNTVGVQLMVSGETGDGHVGVCQSGKARAVMKAIGDHGIISAVHDDGHARISLIGSPGNGELIAVTPDMKAGVKIAAEGPDGGYISVNRANTAIGGTIVVRDHLGNLTGSLPGLPPED